MAAIEARGPGGDAAHGDPAGTGSARRAGPAAVRAAAADAPWTGRQSTAVDLSRVPAPTWSPPREDPGAAPARPAPRRRRRPRPARRPALGVRRELGAIGLAGALALGCVAASVGIAREDLAVQSAGAVVSALQAQNRRLTATYAQLQDPARIDREAVDQLGMHRPAGYVPVARVPMAPGPGLPPAASVQVAVPVPAGPAPGGPVAIGRTIGRRARGAWRAVRGRLAGAGPRGGSSAAS